VLSQLQLGEEVKEDQSPFHASDS